MSVTKALPLLTTGLINSQSAGATLGLFGFADAAFRLCTGTGSVRDLVGTGVDNFAIMTFAATAKSMGVAPRILTGTALTIWQLLQMKDEIFASGGNWKDKLIDAPEKFFNLLVIASNLGLGHRSIMLAKKSRNLEKLKLGNISDTVKSRLIKQNATIDADFSKSGQILAQSTSSFLSPFVNGFRAGWQG